LYPFELANKPGSRAAAAAGGCILVETQALRTGAFANLHHALIDDCTLAAHIKRTGLRTFIGLSHAARSHRGYQALKPIWEMVARTAMFFTYTPTLIYYRRSPLWGFALPIIGTLYLAMTWASALRYWRGERACWKDRRYESKTNN
jgi:hypothetical protein